MGLGGGVPRIQGGGAQESLGQGQLGAGVIPAVRRAGCKGPGGRGGGRKGGTWMALDSMLAGLARAASRAVVVVPMLEPSKRGYARSRLITPTPGGARGHHGLCAPPPRPRARLPCSPRSGTMAAVKTLLL